MLRLARGAFVAPAGFGAARAVLATLAVVTLETISAAFTLGAIVATAKFFGVRATHAHTHV